MSTPGPATSTWPPSGLIPRFENDPIAKLVSNAPTARIEGQFAGWLTGFTAVGRRLSLPAAARIRLPAPAARLATVSKTVE
jgi:hypothetical protein